MSKLVLQMVGPEPIWVWGRAAATIREREKLTKTDCFESISPNTQPILLILAKGAFGGAGRI